MKDKHIINPEQARAYVYAKMYDAGHTPASFAALLGISRQALHKILRGKSQPGPELQKALGMEMAYLVDSQKEFPRGPVYFERPRAAEMIELLSRTVAEVVVMEAATAMLKEQGIEKDLDPKQLDFSDFPRMTPRGSARKAEKKPAKKQTKPKEGK